MKRSCHHLILSFILLLAIIGTMGAVPAVKASAAEDNTAKNYLNAVSKNLYLGVAGKSRFDFDIRKEAMPKSATYRWYVAKDKGEAYCINIDSQTGLVTANLAGTAYIGCKITLPDGTMLQPEAKVTVINNITEIGISNLPEDNIIPIGSPMDFDYKVLNTTAGKDVYTKGIVRWEITNDTTGAGAATDEGVITPKKPGTFDIRTVCFQNIEDYTSWLKNKKAKAGKITAASAWITITAETIEGTAATKDELLKLLSAERIKKIILSTEADLEMTIPEGSYLDKTLIVDAPNTDVTNNAVFQNIIIRNANKSTWNENAKGNSLEIDGCDITLYTGNNAQIKTLTFGSYKLPDNTMISKYKVNEKSDLSDAVSGAFIDLVNIAAVINGGSIDKITVKAASKLVMNGLGKIKQVVVETTGDGSMMASYNLIDYDIYTNVIITLLEGSDGTTIAVYKNASAKVENLSKASVPITYGEANYILTSTGFAVIVSDKYGYTPLGITNVSSVVKFTPVYHTAVTASPVARDSSLSSSMMIGSFDYLGTQVEGILTWASPSTVVKEHGYFQWIFVPSDSKHYNKVYGMVYVEVTN